MKVADMKKSGPADMTHAAAATWSWRRRDPSLPIMSRSVVGLVSVLLMRWPGGGFLLLVESDRFIRHCIQMFFQLVGMQLGGCPKGSPVLFLWSDCIPLSWMGIVLLLLCLLFVSGTDCVSICSIDTMCSLELSTRTRVVCLG
jgi:hypothetical protein